MSGGTWSASADKVLERVFVLGAPAPTRKDIIAAYPFGERKFWPYKVWLRQVKRWAAAHAAGLPRPLTLRARRHRKDPNQGELLDGEAKPVREQAAGAPVPVAEGEELSQGGAHHAVPGGVRPQGGAPDGVQLPTPEEGAVRPVRERARAALTTVALRAIVKDLTAAGRAVIAYAQEQTGARVESGCDCPWCLLAAELDRADRALTPGLKP